MKREVIYSTKLSVRNILKAQENARPTTVWLLGSVERQTDRKLLGFIPLPDRYVWSILTVEEIEAKNGTKSRILKDDELTFESKKRLGEERLNMEEWLRGKCKEYKKMKYGKRG